MARACAHLSLLCILFLFSIALAIAVAILFLDFDPSNFYPNSGHGDRSSSIFNHDPPKFFPNSHHGDRSTSIFNHDPSNFSPSSGHGDRSSSIFNHDPPNFFPSSGHGDRSSSIFNHGPPNFFPNSHHGDRSSSIFNYDALSIPSLSLFLLFLFFFLMKVAGDHFSPAVSLLSDHLRLSPSKAAVTLLALGNGAPDVFSSVAAVRHGQPRTGLGAILSAGAFVSSLVLGFVAINASPFSVQPASFVRDAFFYLVAASALFYVYLSAEIYLWQALGFVLFYVFFVWVVFRMDSACGEEDGVEILAGEVEIEKGLRDEILKPPPASLDAIEASDSDRSFAFMGFFRKHMSSRISVGPGSMGMGGVPSSDILSISSSAGVGGTNLGDPEAHHPQPPPAGVDQTLLRSPHRSLPSRLPRPRPLPSPPQPPPSHCLPPLCCRPRPVRCSQLPPPQEYSTVVCGYSGDPPRLHHGCSLDLGCCRRASELPGCAGPGRRPGTVDPWPDPSCLGQFSW
ncbi:cation exchanger 11 isoform X3 [Wolffia australiana]